MIVKEWTMVYIKVSTLPISIISINLKPKSNGSEWHRLRVLDSRQRNEVSEMSNERIEETCNQ